VAPTRPGTVQRWDRCRGCTVQGGSGPDAAGETESPCANTASPRLRRSPRPPASRMWCSAGPRQSRAWSCCASGPGAGDWQDVTAAQFREQVAALARGLVGAGIGPGDRVALMSRTGYEWALIVYAIWAAGGVVGRAGRVDPGRLVGGRRVRRGQRARGDHRQCPRQARGPGAAVDDRRPGRAGGRRRADQPGATGPR